MSGKRIISDGDWEQYVQLLDLLIPLQQGFAGEYGSGETPVETLERILKQHSSGQNQEESNENND